MKAILAGTLETGRETLSGATVFVEGGKIAAVEPGLDAKGASDVIDGETPWSPPDSSTPTPTWGPTARGSRRTWGRQRHGGTHRSAALDHRRRLSDDHGLADALAGGVTCVQTLPGSGNVIADREPSSRRAPSAGAGASRWTRWSSGSFHHESRTG